VKRCNYCKRLAAALGSQQGFRQYWSDAVGCQRTYIPQWRRLVVSKLVPVLALIVLAGPVMAVAADAPAAGSSAPASGAKSTTTKKHHKKKSTSSAPAAK
jgi:hypothetical protein